MNDKANNGQAKRGAKLDGRGDGKQAGQIACEAT
jgi:hypothetical protein